MGSFEHGTGHASRPPRDRVTHKAKQRGAPYSTAAANTIAEESSSDSNGSLGAAWSAVFLGSLQLLLGAELTRRAPSNADMYEPPPYYHAY